MPFVIKLWLPSIHGILKWYYFIQIELCEKVATIKGYCALMMIVILELQVQPLVSMNYI